MNEMIERVARAIEKAHDNNPQYTRELLCKLMAKAAIEAMREPTEDMKQAKNEHGETIHWEYSCYICGGAKEAWYAMIDAALKE